jgi:hypothetical protein
MRMAGQSCHACFASKAAYQTPQVFWLGVIVVLLLLIAVAVAVY